MKRFILVLATVLAVNCGGSGTVSTNPTTTETQNVRVFAVRVADATTAGLTIANETGVLLNGLPLPAATKDGFDCAILKVTGSTKPPSETVTKVCGAVALTADAPLPKALTTLKSVTTCPSLSATVTAISQAVNPLIAKLESSDQAALKLSAISLRATFAVLSIGGSPCQ